MKRIVFSEQAKADIRAIPQQTAMQILTAIHRLAEARARCKAKAAKSGCAWAIFASASRKKAVRARKAAGAEKAMASFASTPCATARKPTAEPRDTQRDIIES